MVPNKVLIVDDISENRKLLASIIKKNTNYEIMLGSSGIEVLDMIFNKKIILPDIILLDIMMPQMDGFHVIKELKTHRLTYEIPVIFITALDDSESIIKALSMGGVDYITKPFNKLELLARLNTHLRLKNLIEEQKKTEKLLANKELLLKELVNKKTKKIEAISFALVSSLESANLANDDDTGNHIKRVSKYSAAIARKYGSSSSFVKKIELYASLHDVGKVGIPDSILKKPGSLTDEEWLIMKTHVQIGYNMLDNEQIDQMAKNIALYHHEKWDGSGYLNNLKGENIPLEARIVALADVYDALINDRVYKKAFSQEETDSIIFNLKGSHFEPKIVDYYFAIKSEIIEIKNKYR